MGSALAEGLVDAKWCPVDQLAIVEPSVEQRATLNERLPGVAVLTSLEIDHIDEASGVVMCVKPEHAEGVARLARRHGRGAAPVGRRRPLDRAHRGDAVHRRSR